MPRRTWERFLQDHDVNVYAFKRYFKPNFEDLEKNYKSCKIETFRKNHLKKLLEFSEKSKSLISR